MTYAKEKDNSEAKVHRLGTECEGQFGGSLEVIGEGRANRANHRVPSINVITQESMEHTLGMKATRTRRREARIGEETINWVNRELQGIVSRMPLMRNLSAIGSGPCSLHSRRHLQGYG